MKLFTFSFAAIFLFAGCSGLPNSKDQILKVRETYERTDSSAIEVSFQDGWFRLLENGLEISSVESGYGFMQGNVKVNQGRSRVDWRCDSDFYKIYPGANYKCVVTDFTVGLVSQHPNGRRVVSATEGDREIACYGFSEGRKMSCDEYDKSRDFRYKKAKYIYSFKQAEGSNSYVEFIDSYGKNDLGGLMPLAVERQSKIDRVNKDKKRVLAENLKKERAEKIALIKKFRSELKSGDRSNCGLVVDVKRPIVNVQSMNGLVWLKIDEIYPVGLVGCEFYNNVYMHQAPF